MKRMIDIVPDLLTTIKELNSLELTEDLTHSQRNKIGFVRGLLLEKLEKAFRDWSSTEADTLLHRYAPKDPTTDDIPL